MTAKKTRAIWIFNHYAVAAGEAGGTRHFDFGAELTRRGHDVTIFAAGFSHRQHQELKLAERETVRVEMIDGVRFVWVRTVPYRQNDWRRFANMVSYRIQAGRVAARLLGRGELPSPDIIIGSSVHLFAVAAAAAAARRLGARFVMEVRDIWPQTLVDMGAFSPSNPLILYLRRLERRLYNRAELIITTLPLAGEYFAGLGIPLNKIAYIPQAADLRLDSPIKTASPDRPFTVIYIGSFGPADHVATLIEAAAYLQDNKFKFLFVGGGETKTAVVEKAKGRGLTNVEFRDPVPKQAVPGLLAEVDACLLCVGQAELWQRYGMSKNKLIDYMAAAKPIIFAGTVPNDVVTEAACGLTVPSADPREIAAAVRNLSELDRETLTGMGKRGRDYAAAHHSLKKLTDKLERLLDIGSQTGAGGRSREISAPSSN